MRMRGINVVGISFHAEIPPTNLPKIWNPPVGETPVCILGPWLSVWVHWMGKRTLPCLDAECPKSRHSRPVRWVGYAPIAVGRHGVVEVAVLPLSPDKADALRDVAADGAPFVITCKRRESSREWTVDDVKTDLKPEWPVPSPPDVQAVLLRLWGIRPGDLTDGEDD